ncbi:hypothetical protein D3C77_381480 [compost metagenome]
MIYRCTINPNCCRAETMSSNPVSLRFHPVSVKLRPCEGALPLGCTKQPLHWRQKILLFSPIGTWTPFQYSIKFSLPRTRQLCHRFSQRLTKQPAFLAASLFRSYDGIENHPLAARSTKVSTESGARLRKFKHDIIPACS